MPLYYTKLDFMLNYLLVLMVSFDLAFFLSISIEMSFINLGRVFVNGKGRNSNLLIFFKLKSNEDCLLYTDSLKRGTEKMDDRQQQA